MCRDNYRKQGQGIIYRWVSEFTVHRLAEKRSQATCAPCLPLVVHRRWEELHSLLRTPGRSGKEAGQGSGERGGRCRTGSLCLQ